MWLGIDFGTCYSSAAFMLDGTLERVKDSRKLGYSFPSSIYASKEGEILVGHTADYQRNKDPNRYRREFKRDLGRDIPYFLGDRQLLPENLIAEVLRKLKSEADQMVKAKGREPITSAVITVPATYQEHKRSLMKNAAQAAGFARVELLEEPVATAIYYAQHHKIEENEIILVYDLGGGTFDATLMQKQGMGYKLLVMPVGLERCGGVDFDFKIYQDLKQNCSDALRGLLDPQRHDTEALRARLMVSDWCREAKHQLSEVSTFEDMLPGFFSEFYQLSRENFNGMIKSYIDETIQLCEQLSKEAGISWERIDRILLVGGSCRIPYVQQALEQEFQRPVFRADEPELAVCMGAAFWGTVLEERKKADVYISQGMARFVLSEERGAIAYYDEALTINPNSAQAYLNRGLARYKSGDYQGAIEDCDRALEINSDSAIIYYNRGLARIEVGDEQGALEDFNRAGIIPDFEAAKGELKDFKQTEIIPNSETDTTQSKQPTETKPESGLSLSTFSFETVTVNSTGQIIKREQHQAQYFTEKLGNNIALEMVHIPGGKFLMGAPSGEKDSRNSQRPQHQVNVPPFWMGKYPVTQAQWRAVASLPRVEQELEPDPSKFKGNDHPVEQVSWLDAVEFCQRLSRAIGKDYRLPSEAEWEYACRARTTTPFYFGETITTDIANYGGNYTYAQEQKGQYRKKTTPVGSFPPNGFGLYDLHGNVWEWCADNWHNNYEGAPTDGRAWLDKNENQYQVLRGGSWYLNPNLCRSVFRNGGIRRRDGIDNGIGFRVACGGGRAV
jgi:formylglycine-generating enzyme required for sulfatase activity/actin-like ATPase involved in cell morphogenesis